MSIARGQKYFCIVEKAYASYFLIDSFVRSSTNSLDTLYKANIGPYFWYFLMFSRKKIWLKRRGRIHWKKKLFMPLLDFFLGPHLKQPSYFNDNTKALTELKIIVVWSRIDLRWTGSFRSQLSRFISASRRKFPIRTDDA